MQHHFVMRSPSIATPGWHLTKLRPHTYGYRDNPIERGKPVEVAKDLPADIRERLRDLDMHAVDPKRLNDISAHLFFERYISDDSFTELSTYYLDYREPIDIIAMMKGAKRELQGSGDTRWALAIRVYGAAIEAAEGIQGLVDYLSGKLVDTYA